MWNGGRIARCLALGIALALTRVETVADGKVFGTTRAPIAMADQRALVHWMEGVETLVIGSRFEGKGADFAWVIPLPNAPEVALADRGVLTTLAVVLQPRIVDRHWPGWGIFSLVALGLGALAVYGRALAIHPVIRGLGIAAIALLGVSLFMPMLAAVGGPARPRDAVRILATHEIGDYALVTLAGTEANALANWLRERGYFIPEPALPAIEAHARRGGVFVAARLRPALADTVVRALAPLQLRFSTPTPIYPMALTGAGATRPLDLELYVLGPGRAHAAPMRTVRCSRIGPVPAGDAKPQWGSPETLSIGQASLVALIGSATVATHLRATLEPTAMQRDIELEWCPYAAVGETVYTSSAALALAFDVWATVCSVALFATVAIRVARRRPHGLRLPLGIAATFTLVGLGHRAILPTIDGPLRSEHPALVESRVRNLCQALADAPRIGDTTRLDHAWFAAQCASLREAGGLDDADLSNHFTGAPIALEASPGNLTITRRADGSIVLYAHDATGAPVLPHVVPSMPAIAGAGSVGASQRFRLDRDDFRMAVRYHGWHTLRYGTFVTATSRYASEIAAIERRPLSVAFVATPEEVGQWATLIGAWAGERAMRDGRLAVPDGYEGYTVEIESAGRPMHAVLGWDVETFRALRDLDVGCRTTPGHGLRTLLAPLEELYETWVERRYARLLGADWHRIVIHTGEGSGSRNACAPVLEAVREPGGVRVRPTDATRGPGRLLATSSKELATFQRELHRFAVHHTVNPSLRSTTYEVYAIDIQAAVDAAPERIVQEHGAMPLAGGGSFGEWIEDWISRVGR